MIAVRLAKYVPRLIANPSLAIPTLVVAGVVAAVEYANQNT